MHEKVGSARAYLRRLNPLGLGSNPMRINYGCGPMAQPGPFCESPIVSGPAFDASSFGGTFRTSLQAFRSIPGSLVSKKHLIDS